MGFTALLAVAIIALACAASGSSVHVALVPNVASRELRLDFGVSPLAVPFLSLVALVTPAVGLWTLRRGAAIDGLRLAPFVAAMIGVLLAQSCAGFFVAWETMTLFSAFLVGTDHQRRDVRRALLSYVLISQLGALCIAAALALLATTAGDFRFPLIAAAAPTVPAGIRSAVVALALVGFGSKAGLLPLHFWLPRAHPVAPASASALLSGVMLNVALYGLLTVVFGLAAPVSAAWGTAILVIGLLTAIVGALYAAVESDVKRLLAYSSVENLGMLAATLGLAIVSAAMGTPVLAELALTAVLLHALSHGTFKTLLFLCAGNVHDVAHTTDLEALGGLRRTLPYTGAMFAIACASAAALPPLTGFASEWLILTAFIRALSSVPIALAMLCALALGTLAATGGLAAVAFVKLFGIAFLGRPRVAHEAAIERADPSTLGLAWLAAACVGLGVAPVLVIAKLAAVAGTVTGIAAVDATPLPILPTALAALPIAGALVAFAFAQRRGLRRVPTWTCGSVVTPRSQYTAMAFSKPIRRIFAFVLFPDHQHVAEGGNSRWFPQRIRYSVTTRYVFDEMARNVAAFAQRSARRSRIVQAGLLRVYLAYAVVAVLIVLVVAR